MELRNLGTSGLKVSVLSLGAMTFGESATFMKGVTSSDADAKRVFDRAIERGVNLVDTANVYNEGKSEELTGKWIKDKRHKVLLATKCRFPMGFGMTEKPGPHDMGLSRQHIVSACEASLKRLGTDHIDLYQMHMQDRSVRIEETMRALDDVVRAGKTRYVGFCNLSAWQAMKALAFADRWNLSRFVSAQVYYSIGGRDIEREIVPLAQAEGLAILPWSPLAGGLLSGKFDPDKPGPEGARRTSFDFPPVDRARLPKVLGALREVAAATNASVARVALAWQLTRPFVTSVIIGARNREQLADNLAAADLELAHEHVAKLDEASALAPEYPGWMLDWQNRDRRPPTR